MKAMQFFAALSTTFANGWEGRRRNAAGRRIAAVRLPTIRET